MKILLTDGLQRKTLAAVRSLGQKGNQIFVAEYTRANPAAYSKYAFKGLKSPDPRTHGEAYYTWLLAVLLAYEIDLFIPMDDAAMAIAVKHQDQLKAVVKMLVPSEADYLEASDKGSALKRAKALGADCPMTLFPKTEEELKEISKAIAYPVLIKPRQGSGSRGIKRVENREILLSIAQKSKIPSIEMPLIQTYIEQGEKYDVCLIFDEEGRKCASFVQREVRQFPEPMGPSTVQVSVENQALVELSEKIMTSFHWKGVAEVEFMKSPRDDKYYFMEINTRFWASLPCAIFSGVDFPQIYKQILTGEEVNVEPYQLGLLCRWLFPGDFLRLISFKKGMAWVPPFTYGRRQGVRDDVYDPEDRMPLLGVFVAALRFVLDIKMWKILFWR